MAIHPNSQTLPQRSPLSFLLEDIAGLWVIPSDKFFLLPLADLNDTEGPTKLLVLDLQAPSSLLSGMW